MKLQPTPSPTPPPMFAHETGEVERIAMEAVMDCERKLGNTPRDVSALKCGYDIESQAPGGAHLRFLEVKGRVVGAETVTITRNEILTALNKPDDFILAFVEVNDGRDLRLHHVHRPIAKEPDFGVTSIKYNLNALIGHASPVSK